MIRSMLLLATVALFSLTTAENLRSGDIAEAISLGGISYASRSVFSDSGGRCRTPDLTDDEVAERERDMAAMPFEIAENAGTVTNVRVYFHIITSTSGVGSIPAGTINAQLETLNKAYQGSMVQFVLAGTTITANNAWYQARMGSSEEDQMKAALRIGAYKDLNVYTTVQADNTLGWATFPGNVGPDYHADGLVIDYRTMPGNTNFAPYNRGMTATHEIGHWLGLQHPFNGGCNPSVTGGDLIKDTPAEASPSFGCPVSRDTCPGNSGALAGADPIHNYMDYSDDSCMNNFTPLQRTRMKKQWVLYRKLR